MDDGLIEFLEFQFRRGNSCDNDHIGGSDRHFRMKPEDFIKTAAKKVAIYGFGKNF